MPEEKLVTYREAAEICGISPTTVRIWTSKKKIPHYKINSKTTRYSPSELRAWLEAQHVQPIGVSK